MSTRDLRKTKSLDAPTMMDDTDDSSESEHEDGIINGTNQVSPIDEAMLMKMPVGSQSNLLNTFEDNDYTHMTIFEAAREGSLEKIKSQLECMTRDDEIKRALEELNNADETPLHVAAKYNHENIIRYFASYNVWMDSQDRLKNTPLHTAMKYDSFIAAKTLIEMGANVHIKNDYGVYPIHFAASRGHKDLCRLLISYKEVDINAPDNGKCSPLHVAVSNQRISVIQLLLGHKASPFTEDLEGRYPLHIAASDGSPQIVEILLRSMSRISSEQNIVDVTTNDKKTPLHLACLHGHVATVQKLLDRKANVNSRCKSHTTPIHLAATYGRCDVIKMLIQYGSLLNVRDGYQMTPLHRACLYGRVNVISLLCTLGAQVELLNDAGFTPLLCAVWNGNIETVRYLIKCGVNFKAKDISERNILHLAIQRKHYKLLEVLFEYDAIALINQTDKNYWTPLHYATAFASIKCQRILLSHNAIVTARNRHRKTPLHFAAWKGKPSAAQLLCEVAQNCIDQSDDSLKTPLILAAMNGNSQICEVLLSFGADVAASDDVKSTALHYACANGYPCIAKMLLENHALIDAGNLNSETPLHLAAKFGHVECIDVLIENGGKVEARDKSGKNCLDLAIENYKKNACMRLLKNSRWRILMQNVDNEGKRPMGKMIKCVPGVAEYVLDNCIEYSTLEKEHIDYSITYSFAFLCVSPEEDEDLDFCGPSIMAKHNRESLLAHSVTISFINLKWKLVPRSMYYMSLLLYIAFLVLLTRLIISEREWYDLSHEYFKYHRNATKSSMLRGCDNNKSLIVPCLILVYCIIQIIKEFVEFLFGPLNYILDIVNYMEIVLYTSSLIFVLTFFIGNKEPCALHMHDLNDESKQMEALRISSGAAAIMLAYCNLLFYLKRFPFVGLIVLTFIEVLKTVIIVLIIFGCLIVGFSLTFYFLNIDALSVDEDFYSFKASILKVVSMTIGDGSMAKKRKLRNSSLSEVNDYMYLVFALLLPIVMVNLMIGLAVGEIANVTQTAKLCMLKDQVRLVTRLQNKYPKSYLRQAFQPGVTVYPNRRNIWVRFTDWLRAYTFESLVSSSTVENADPKSKVQDDGGKLKDELAQMKGKMKKLMKQSEEQKEMVKKILETLTVESSEPETKRSLPVIKCDFS